MTFKQKLFLWLHICVPLFAGLFIYLFFYKGTYINLFFENVFHLSSPSACADGLVGVFLRCWAADMLWAYSFVFTLYCVLYRHCPVWKIAVLVGTVSVLVEGLQLIGFIGGTFDWFDILLELAAIGFAVILLKRGF